MFVNLGDRKREGSYCVAGRDGAARGVRGRLASWCGKSAPRRRSVAGLRGWSATLGLRTAQTPTGGSSEGSSAMGASLTEQRRVRDDAFRSVNRFSGGRGSTDGTPGRSLG